MSDLITGLCVLEHREKDGLDYLFHIQQKANGEYLHDDIPCYELGKPVPPWHGPIWKYKREGNQLVFFPSVNHISFGFHNGSCWTVYFVEIPLEVSHSVDAGAIHRELNYTPELNGASPDHQTRCLAELSAAGTILIPRPAPPVVLMKKR